MYTCGRLIVHPPDDTIIVWIDEWSNQSLANFLAAIRKLNHQIKMPEKLSALAGAATDETKIDDIAYDISASESPII
jgi:hypothetical protein